MQGHFKPKHGLGSLASCERHITIPWTLKRTAGKHAFPPQLLPKAMPSLTPIANGTSVNSPPKNLVTVKKARSAPQEGLPLSWAGCHSTPCLMGAASASFIVLPPHQASSDNPPGHLVHAVFGCKTSSRYSSVPATFKPSLATSRASAKVQAAQATLPALIPLSCSSMLLSSNSHMHCSRLISLIKHLLAQVTRLPTSPKVHPVPEEQGQAEPAIQLGTSLNNLPTMQECILGFPRSCYNMPVYSQRMHPSCTGGHLGY